jgi:predicted Ser/Thr protein kinase
MNNTQAVIQYPNIVDYCDALVSPQRCFNDPVLKMAKVELDLRGDPLPRTGGNAAVFKLVLPNKSLALKVFRFPNPVREQRYQKISDFLAENHSRYLVGFRYRKESIRANRSWFPILTMDWVEGSSLTEWAGGCVKRRDTKALLQLAERWIELLRHLKSMKISHGDLQHGNVLVVQNDFILVDYDGMCVPSLVGEEAWEHGLPGYQHPQRERQQLTLSLDADDFSAWIIWLGLRALACDLTLWQRYIEKNENENLLFRDEDLLHPERSKLWPELLNCRDAEVAAKARLVRKSLDDGFATIPKFSFDPYGPLNDACNARDWERIVALAASLPQLPTDKQDLIEIARRKVHVHAQLKAALASGDPRQILAVGNTELLADWPACQNALGELARVRQQRQAARDRVVTLLDTSAQDQTILEAFEHLQKLGGDPDLPETLPRLGELRKKIVLLTTLRQLMATPSEESDRRFVQLFHENEELILATQQTTDVQSYHRIVLERLRTLSELLKRIGGGYAMRPKGMSLADYYAQIAEVSVPKEYAHSRGETHAQAVEWMSWHAQLLAACQQDQRAEIERLTRSQRIHRVVPEELRHQVSQAWKSVDALRTLEALNANSLHRLAAAYDGEFLNDWRTASPIVSKAQLARELQPAIQQLETLAKDLSHHRQLVALWDGRKDWPTGFAEIEALRQRVEQARTQSQVIDELQNALKEPISDLRLADACDRYLQVGLMINDAQIEKQCRLAGQRRQALRDMRTLGVGMSLDEEDKHVLLCWQEGQLDQCNDVTAEERQRVELARSRQLRLRELLSAIDRRSYAELRALGVDPLLLGYPPFERRRAIVQELLAEGVQVGTVQQVLQRNLSPADIRVFSLACVNQNPRAFQGEEARLRALLQREIDKVRLVADGSVEVSSASEELWMVKVRWAGWSWLPMGLGDRICRVALNEDGYFMTPGEARTYLTNQKIHTAAGGVVLPVSRGWQRVCLTIWPVLRLEGMSLEVHGRGIQVGPIRRPSGKVRGKWSMGAKS